MAATANKDTYGVKGRPRRKKGTMIAQCSTFVILLTFCLSLLVFTGEERDQDEGEEGGGRGRGDGSSSYQRRSKTRRLRKKV